jgi:peptidoglycan hydrolase-like protein with peptidoglycan-binding domain
MKNMTRFVGLVLGLSLLAPQAIFAQTATTTSVANLLATITQLTQQINDLKAQLNSLQKQAKDAKQELARTLNIGSQGDDVKTIQVLLASDPSLYPEGVVSGYYGVLTAKAIKRFQQRYGIEAAGFVGPKTLKKINELLAEGILVVTAPQNATSTPTISINPAAVNSALTSATSTMYCLVTPPGHLIAPGYLKKDNGDNEDKGDDNGRGNGHGKEKEHERRPFSIPCNFLPPGILKKIDHGTTTSPVADTTTPVISNISVTGITSSGALVNWTTNEPTYSQFAYGTTTDYSVTTAWSGSLAVNYTQTLTGLMASTTYHFQVRTKDLAGNTATSSDMVFTTSAVADLTPPVISSVAAGNITSTAATITWMTDEAATSKVYYGTSTPLNLGTALTGSNSLLVTAHSMPLSGLTASSTYYYVVESQDGSGNTATSTESSLVTLP